jgi:tetratricopeptide (TPR) repeat protein
MRAIKCLTPLIFAILISSCHNDRLLHNPNIKTGYINEPKTISDIEKNKELEKEYINLSPMYGYAIKDDRYKKYDRDFIDTTLLNCKCDLSTASISLSDLGWKYFQKINLEVSLKRFNQSYLLDSTNYQLYWGFAAIMGFQKRNDEAINLFNKAFHYYKEPKDSHYVRLCIDATNPFIDIYMQTKDKRNIDSAFKLLIQAYEIQPDNPKVTNLFSHLSFEIGDYQKALDYYNKVITLDKAYSDFEYFRLINKNLEKN